MTTKKASRKVSDRDIKLLYGRSAARCNICRQVLIEPKIGEDGFVHLGEMAHNVAFSDRVGAPRAIDGMSGDNSYNNLILLCPSDHERVDQNTAEYTVEKIRLIKKKFEEWINDRLSLKEKPDSQMVKTIYSLINVQEILNSLEYAPTYIGSDITDWGDLYNEFFLKNSPSSYPFKDIQLQKLTENINNLYFELREYLLFNNKYIFNAINDTFKINHSEDLRELCNLAE